MRFQVNGDTFVIEFQRRHKDVPAIVGVATAMDDVTKKRIEVPVYQEVNSTHPYTTCNIVKVGPDGKREVYRTATAGCFTGDRFDYEEGRKTVLRKLSKLKDLTDDFKNAMWSAYLKRNNRDLNIHDVLRDLILAVDPQLPQTSVDKLINRYVTFVRRAQ